MRTPTTRSADASLWTLLINLIPPAWPDTGLHAAWLGHSTVLLKIDGTTLLTEPAPGPSRRSQTHRRPRPDLILLSHAHMDHFDLPTLHLLESPPAPKNTRPSVNWPGGEDACFGDLTVRAFQVKHRGARPCTDTYRGYNGYVIESSRYRGLFGGDTAMTDTFRPVRTSRAIDLAVMPIGA